VANKIINLLPRGKTMKIARILKALMFVSIGSAFAAPPVPPMNWTSPSGSVLTLDSTMTTGTYLDNDGIGNCQKGQTYQLSGIQTSGNPGQPGTIKFSTSLCYPKKQATLKFKGVIQTQPSLPMQVGWTFTSSTTVKNQTWTTPLPPAPPCLPGLPCSGQ
jgi:hypothetical protein